MNDMEFMASQAPKEAPPTARPQHLKFARDLANQRDWEDMAAAMPEAWFNILEGIIKGDDQVNGQPILRPDVCFRE